MPASSRLAETPPCSSCRATEPPAPPEMPLPRPSAKARPLGLDLDQSAPLRELDIASLLTRALSIEPTNLVYGLLFGIANELDALGIAVGNPDSSDDPCMQDALYLLSVRCKVAAELARRQLIEARGERQADGAAEGEGGES